MYRFSFLKQVFFALFISIVLQHAPAFSQDERVNSIILGAGDAIHLSVYDGAYVVDEKKFISNYHNEVFVINGFGEIDLYTLGYLKVEGKNAREISDLLKEVLRPYAKDPMIIVKPLVRITLRGEFGKPGMYRYSLDTTFWDMIQTAGGLIGGIDGLSALEDMFIMRKDEIIYKDFVDAVYSATSLYDLGLQSGDELVVPRANRPTFRSMMRYFQFGSSLIILYLTLLNRT